MSASNIILTLVGGPTVLVEFGGIRLLTDPTFDPPGQYQGPHSPVTHVKTTGPALSAEQVGILDAVLLSHDHHFDNLDTSGRTLLLTVPVTYTTVLELSVSAEMRSVSLPSRHAILPDETARSFSSPVRRRVMARSVSTRRRYRLCARRREAG
jgi:Cft2 family RNA processing exonuclease